MADLHLSRASSTDFSQPSSGVTTSGIGANSWMLYSGNEVNVPVTFGVVSRSHITGADIGDGSSSYAVGIEGIKWTNETDGGNQTTSFMSGNVDWRTAGYVLP